MRSFARRSIQRRRRQRPKSGEMIRDDRALSNSHSAGRPRVHEAACPRWLARAHLLRRFLDACARPFSFANPETVVVNCGRWGKSLLMRVEDIFCWTVECEECRPKLSRDEARSVTLAE